MPVTADKLRPAINKVLIINTLAIFASAILVVPLIFSIPSLSPLSRVFLSAALVSLLVFPVAYLLMHKMLLPGETDFRLSENQLELATQVLENAIEGVMITDDKINIQSVNPAFTAITGYSAEEAIGKNPRILRSNKHNDEFYKKMWRSIIDSGRWQGEIWNRRKNGEAYPEWLTIIAIKDKDGKTYQYVAIFHDLTDIKRSQEKVKYQANYDALTGLSNKVLFKDRMNQSLVHAKQNKQIVSILLLNIDRLKKINESLGHPVGDILLQDIAERLKSCIKEGDTISRWGGDEFAFILGNLTHKEDVLKIALRILQSFKKPFILNDREVYVTASMGISLYPTDGENADILSKNTETAMYHAKEKGRNNCQLYASEMNVRALEQMELENNLRKAIEKEEFVIHYQPKVNLNTGKIVGVESLVRWQTNGKGLVAPDKFIPLAEETGLIIPLGKWVLRKACEQNMAWQNAGYPPMCVSVNLSARQFEQKDLIEMTKSILEETGLPPEQLDFEITESIVMNDMESAKKILQKLSSMGVHLSMDDFGTGYSSLSYLKQFPLNSLKIDQSFVRDVTTNSDDAAIAKAIIALAHSLKLKVVAEGVETEDHLAFMQKNKCDEIQGYYFSPPLTVDKLTELLDNGQQL